MAKSTELTALHRDLIALGRTLSKKQQQTNEVAAIIAISRELTEVAHRTTLVGQLLFTEQTAELKKSIDLVKAARVELNEAIQKIERLNAFLKSISKFLGLVDKVIDLAKII